MRASHKSPGPGKHERLSTACEGRLIPTARTVSVATGHARSPRHVLPPSVARNTHGLAARESSLLKDWRNRKMTTCCWSGLGVNVDTAFTPPFPKCLPSMRADRCAPLPGETLAAADGNKRGWATHKIKLQQDTRQSGHGHILRRLKARPLSHACITTQQHCACAIPFFVGAKIPN